MHLTPRIIKTGFLLVAFAVAFYLLASPPTYAKNGWGRVQLEKRKRQIKEPKTILKVIDGATIQLEAGEKVSLIGVSAPEADEPFHTEATKCLKEILGGGKVRLELGVEPHDQDGRTLAHIYTEEGIYANAELLKRGCAKLMVKGANTGHVDELVASQEEARKAKRGVWSTP